MFLKFGVLVLCLLGEIGFGIYTYLHFESLFTRFLFFVFTAAFVAVIVIRLAEHTVPNENEEKPSGSTANRLHEKDA